MYQLKSKLAKCKNADYWKEEEVQGDYSNWRKETDNLPTTLQHGNNTNNNAITITIEMTHSKNRCNQPGNFITDPPESYTNLLGKITDQKLDSSLIELFFSGFPEDKTIDKEVFLALILFYMEIVRRLPIRTSGNNHDIYENTPIALALPQYLLICCKEDIQYNGNKYHLGFLIKD